MCSSQAREAVLAPAQRTVEVEAHHVVLEEAGVRWDTLYIYNIYNIYNVYNI